MCLSIWSQTPFYTNVTNENCVFMDLPKLIHNHQFSFGYCALAFLCTHSIATPLILPLSLFLSPSPSFSLLLSPSISLPFLLSLYFFLHDNRVFYVIKVFPLSTLGIYDAHWWLVWNFDFGIFDVITCMPWNQACNATHCWSLGDVFYVLVIHNLSTLFPASHYMTDSHLSNRDE